jgi:hypothetical protein
LQTIKTLNCSPRDFKAHQGYGLGSAKWDSQVHDGTWLLGYIPQNQGCIKLMQVSKEKPQGAWNLKKTVKVGVRVTPVELKKAAVGAVCNSHIQSFRIRAERNACHFTKEINFLTLREVLLGVKHMHKVSRLSHSHETPIRSEAEGTNSTNAPL